MTHGELVLQRPWGGRGSGIWLLGWRLCGDERRYITGREARQQGRSRFSEAGHLCRGHGGVRRQSDFLRIHVHATT